MAFNSVANGKIVERTPFEEVYIQPAAGDAGTALGAAFSVWHQTLGQPRAFEMQHAYWGPEFSDEVMRRCMAAQPWGYREFSSPEVLCQCTAEHIAAGKVVGWFQGRMEWGPRALGNRSILADPRRADMRDVLNALIKRREPFRPFCPSILHEQVGEYFAGSPTDPFMITVYPIQAGEALCHPGSHPCGWQRAIANSAPRDEPTLLATPQCVCTAHRGASALKHFV